MKTQNNIDVEEMDLEVDEYDEFQYETTTEMANEFLDNTILPLLEEFDYRNPSNDYIPGVASLGLFAKLVAELTANGFCPEQLKDTVEEFTAMGSDQTLH